MEQWKAVPEFEMYEVSDAGRVRRWKKTKKEWKEVQTTTYSNAPYKMFTVSKNGDHTKLYLHRVIATLFVANDNLKETPDVCFKDGNITNTIASNLYWSNQKERMGRRKKEGKYHTEGHNAKLTEENVKEIRSKWMNRIWEPCETQAEMAKHYGVHQWSIYACIKRITWKHVQ
jgi:hypothetical protein